MSGNGSCGRVSLCARRLWTFLARPFKRPAPSEEVQELKQHLRDAHKDDAKLSELTRRKDKLLRDNHLVSDVERALGLRS